MFIDRTNQRDRRPAYGDQKQKHREKKPGGGHSSSADDDSVEVTISVTDLEVVADAEPVASHAHPVASSSSPYSPGSSAGANPDAPSKQDAEPAKPVKLDIEA